ncbi:MAG: histidinol-phosphate transaminase [Ferrimicrobium sp.]
MTPTPRIAGVLQDRYHSPQITVEVRLNTNESPYPPPEVWVRDIQRRVATLDFNRYPDRGAHAVREELGRWHGVSPEQIFVGNGSNEVLLYLFLAYGGPGREAVMAPPTYGMYRQIAATTGTLISECLRDSAGTIEPVDFAKRSRSAQIGIVCTPNNPTGTPEPDTLSAVFSSCPDTLFIVDNAYGEFSKARTPTAGGNVVVVRTFSKAFGLAGLRVGYCIADPEVIAVLDSITLPYHLDVFKQTAVLVALEHRLQLQAVVDEIVAQRQRIVAGLRELEVRVYPSETNFVLFSPLKPARSVWEELVERSVLIRDASTWPGLENALRVTVGTSSENDRFLAALKEILHPVAISRRVQ